MTVHLGHFLTTTTRMPRPITLLGVVGLDEPDLLVEVEAVAVLP